jgi:hypothetical protein
MYGVDAASLTAWNAISGTGIQTGEPVKRSGTTLLLMRHPLDRVTDQEWLRQAAMLIEANSMPRGSMK